MENKKVKKIKEQLKQLNLDRSDLLVNNNKEEA